MINANLFSNSYAPSAAPIRVALVDDHPFDRQHIVGLIAFSEDINLLWQANNGEEALEKLKQKEVDVLICDIRMPKLNGIDTVKQLRETNNNTPVLMLTTFSDYHLLISGISSGANGFILKNITHYQLISAIYQVLNGNFMFENAVLQHINASQKETAKGIQNKITLSTREYEILSLMAGGFSNQDIANAIFLAEGTVKNHITAIFLKLKTQGRTETIVTALKLSLIS